jgi:sRNA-binding protein
VSFLPGRDLRIARRVLWTLRDQFPQCFCKRRHPKKPLMRGIKADILERLPHLNPDHVSLALKDYMASTRYLAFVIEGEPLVDLDGNQRGAVNKTEAIQAKCRLDQLMANNERQAKREAA